MGVCAFEKANQWLAAARFRAQTDNADQKTIVECTRSRCKSRIHMAVCSDDSFDLCNEDTCSSPPLPSLQPPHS